MSGERDGSEQKPQKQDVLREALCTVTEVPLTAGQANHSARLGQMSRQIAHAETLGGASFHHCGLTISTNCQSVKENFKSVPLNSEKTCWPELKAQSVVRYLFE